MLEEKKGKEKERNPNPQTKTTTKKTTKENGGLERRLGKCVIERRV